MGPKKNISLVKGEIRLLDYDELLALLIELNKKCSGGIAKNFGLSPGDILKKYFPDRYAAEKHNAHALKIARKETMERERIDLWFDSKSRPRDPFAPGEGKVDIFANMPRGQTSIVRRASINQNLPYKGGQDGSSSRNAVTDFSNWVYQLDHPERNGSHIARQQEGRAVEELVQIIKQRRADERRERRQVLGEPRLDLNVWRPIFIDDFSDTQTPLESTSLLVNGRSIFGRPDYLFFNPETKTALIVEIKSSKWDLPEQGWPNLKAQLWAYGHLDEVKTIADEVILIGEVWHHVRDGAGHRKTYCWDLSDKQFYSEQHALFSCFQQHAHM